MSGRRGNHEGTFTTRADGRVMGRVQVTDPATGESVRITVYGRTVEEAREKVRQRVVDATRGQALVEVDRAATVATYLTGWLATSLPASGRRPATVAQYETLLRRHVIPRIGDVRLGRLTRRHVEQAILGMEADGLGASTRRSAYAALRAALDDAVTDRALPRNPVHDVHRPRPARPDVTYATATQAAKLVEASRGHRWHVGAVLLAACGLRRGELLALRWRDVDLNTGTLRVTGSLSRVKRDGRWVLAIDEPKSDSGRRTVPLSPVVVEALREHRTRQDAERRAAGDAWTSTGLLVTSEVGTAVDPRNFTRAFEAWAAKAGVPDLRPHGLRHGLATELLAAGTSPRDVAAVLGHADPAVTLEVYAHALEDAQRAAVTGHQQRLRIDFPAEDTADGLGNVVNLDAWRAAR